MGATTTARRVGCREARASGAFTMAMHYPRRVSTLKKKRAMGFRARMRTKSGRKIINARRRIGRRIGFKA